NRLAVAHGERRYSWREALERCRRLASALTARGIERGDTVALMAPNIPEAFEAHYGVPMAGAVLNALNIRLDPGTIAFILSHGEAKALIADTEFAAVIAEALAQLERKPLVIDIADAMGPGGERLGEMDYEAFAREGGSHLCGAPVVMNMLLNAGSGLKRSLDRRIEMMTAGAPPPAAVIEGMEALGFHITHVYGLTEVYGPAVVCAWHDEWDALPAPERAR